MYSAYGIRGFFFDDERGLEPTSTSLGCTDPPMSVGYYAEFEERTNSDMHLSYPQSGGSLLEFNVSYTNIAVFNSSEYVPAYHFDVDVIFHILNKENQTNIKIDTIIDLNTIDFPEISKDDPYNITFHNDYWLQDQDIGENIDPVVGEEAVFQKSGLPVSTFDLGDNFTVEYFNDTSEVKDLYSLILLHEDFPGHYSYHYWSILGASDEAIDRIVYDPEISIYTSTDYTSGSNSGMPNIPGLPIIWTLIFASVALTFMMRRKSKSILKEK